MLKDILLCLTAYVSCFPPESIVEEEIQATKAENSVQPPPGKTYKYVIVTIWPLKMML